MHGKTWTPKGKIPSSIAAVSAVKPGGGFWFATCQGELNAELFIELLKKMMKCRRKPVHFPYVVPGGLL